MLTPLSILFHRKQSLLTKKAEAEHPHSSAPVASASSLPIPRRMGLADLAAPSVIHPATSGQPPLRIPTFH